MAASATSQICFFAAIFGIGLTAYRLKDQTLADTTTSSRKPIGTRGAVMADTVGETLT